MKLSVTALVLIALAGLGYCLWWDWHHPEIHFLWGFLAGQPASLLALMLLSLRIWQLSRRRLALPLVFKVNGVALIAAMALPAKLSDFAIKPLLFKRLASFPVQEATAIVVKERFWDAVGFAILCAAIPWFLPDAPLVRALEKAALVLAIGGASGVVALVIAPRLITRLPFAAGLVPFIAMLRHGSLYEHLLQLMLSLMIWASSIATLYFFYNNTGLPTLGVAQISLVFAVSVLGLIVTVMPGGLGTYEAAFVAALIPLGLRLDEALAVAIGFRFCWLALPLLILLWTMMRDGSQLLTRRRNEEHNAPQP